MATVNGITKANTNNNVVKSTTLAVAINSPAVVARFEKMLGENAASFLSSVLTVCSNNKLLQGAEYRTILAAAATAASLKLPVLPTLNKAYIVPYKGQAQFQLGYKGWIELAQRSGKMKKIIMTEVREGELKNWNKFSEEYELGEAESDAVVGYFAAFETVNGFKKAVYWTKDAVTKHAKKYSKSFNSSISPWQTDFDKMACKTVLLSILKTFAPMSVEMQKAIEADGSVKTMDIDTGTTIDIDVDNDNGENVKEDNSENFIDAEIAEA